MGFLIPGRTHKRIKKYLREVPHQRTRKIGFEDLPPELIYEVFSFSKLAPLYALNRHLYRTLNLSSVPDKERDFLIYKVISKSFISQRCGSHSSEELHLVLDAEVCNYKFMSLSLLIEIIDRFKISSIENTKDYPLLFQLDCELSNKPNITEQLNNLIGLFEGVRSLEFALTTLLSNKQDNINTVTLAKYAKILIKASTHCKMTTFESRSYMVLDTISPLIIALDQHQNEIFEYLLKEVYVRTEKMKVAATERNQLDAYSNIVGWNLRIWDNEQLWHFLREKEDPSLLEYMTKFGFNPHTL
ncbi:BA75_00215T0 [Komagataella pastoris]|uniref:BA75_00215T0 n=1 Tax=Komagataella pastoris TaxID=4922 RepID=A0A1B2J707_PICPA|nr:BA75_00215T0 [Komagataella pastoris]